jgi:hypothetical protein
MHTKPFLIYQDSKGKLLSEIDPRRGVYNEAWLQELIRTHPELLPTGEIEPVFAPLIPIGREVQTSVGYIDNIFISPQGYLVIVETKLWRNPDAKRDVLAQAIDYSSSVATWTYTDIDKITRDYLRVYERTNCSLIEWIESHRQEIENPEYFEDSVSRNLKHGRFLLLVVGDRIRSSVIDMLKYVNKYPHLSVNVALVELQCFKVGKDDEWPLLIIPSTLAQTQIVERSVVQITVNHLDKTEEIEVTQEKDGENGTRSRVRLSEDEYWEKMKNQAPKCVDSAKRIIDYFRDIVILKPRANSMAVHMYVPESDQRISLFFIRTDGVIESWVGTIASQLESAGLDKSLLETYQHDLAPLLRAKTKSLSISSPADKVDPDKFIEVVERFIHSVLSAEPV